MDYYKKYSKYKYKYLYKKTKMTGGVKSECLFINTHGKETGENIKLKEDQMVILFYKPFCVLSSSMYLEIMRITKFSDAKCNISHYITLQELLKKFTNSYDIDTLMDFAIYSGNSYDVNFFNVILDDGNIVANDISKIPEIEFSFEKVKNEKPIAFSFPVSEDQYITNEFIQYHRELDIGKSKYKIPEDIYYRNYKSTNTIDTIKLSDYLKMFSLIWVVSCRKLSHELYMEYDIKKRIGVPFIIFILYSYYRIIIDVLNIDENEIKNIKNEFHEKSKKIFEKYEFSHNKIEFTNLFMNILNETLIKVLEFKFGYIKINTEDRNNLNIIVTILNELIQSKKIKTPYEYNDNILHVLSYNANNIKDYLAAGYGSMIETAIVLKDCVLKYMYIVSYIIAKRIDYNKILDTFKSIININTISDEFLLLDYNKIKKYKFDDLKKIKLSEQEKKNYINIYNSITIKIHLEKIFEEIRRISEHYYNIINYIKKNNYKYQFNIIEIPRKIEELLISYKDNFNVETIYWSIFTNKLSILIDMIDVNLDYKYNLINISKNKPIKIFDLQEKKEVIFNTNEIKNIIDKKLDENCDNWNTYINLFEKYMKGEDFTYIMIKLVNIENLLLDIFTQKEINIVKIKD